MDMHIWRCREREREGGGNVQRQREIMKKKNRCTEREKKEVRNEKARCRDKDRHTGVLTFFVSGLGRLTVSSGTPAQ